MSSQYHRLDSESADGTDGRLDAIRSAVVRTVATTTTAIRRRVYSLRFGDWVSIVLTLAVVAVVGTAFVGPIGALLAVGGGLATALTLVATNSDNPLLIGIGISVAMLGGGASLLILAFVVYIVLQTGFFGVFASLGLFSLGVATLGAFLAPTRTLSVAAILRTSVFVWLACAGVLGLFVAQILPRTALRQQAADAGIAAGQVGAATILSVDPQHALATFFILLSIALFSLGSVIVRVPVERLLPADRRGTVVRLVSAVQRWRSTAVRLSGVLGAIIGLGLLINVAVPESPDTALVLEYTQLLRTDRLVTVAPNPLGEFIVAIVASQTVRAVLIVTVAVCLGAIGGGKLLGALRRGLAWTLVRLAAPIVGGAVAAVPFGLVASELGVMDELIAAMPDAVPTPIRELLELVPSFAAGTLVVLVLLGAFLVTLGVLGALMTVLVLPSRAGSVALASVGLFGVAIAAVVVDLVAIGVGTAAVALYIWDIGEFGTGLRAELPAGSPTLRTETIHASGSLLYCSAGAIGAWALYHLVMPQLTPATADIAAVGLVVSLGVAALYTFRVTGS